MVADLAAILLCGVPGLAVWLTGYVLTLTRQPSTPAALLGVRLTILGPVTGILGMLAALVVEAIASGRWIVAVVVLVVLTPQTLILFLLASRRRGTHRTHGTFPRRHA